MKTMKIGRTCRFPKDIQYITGRSERYERKLLNEIKIHFGKLSYQFMKSTAFAEYATIDLDIANGYLQKVS